MAGREDKEGDRDPRHRRHWPNHPQHRMRPVAGARVTNRSSPRRRSPPPRRSASPAAAARASTAGSCPGGASRREDLQDGLRRGEERAGSRLSFAVTTSHTARPRAMATTQGPVRCNTAGRIAAMTDAAARTTPDRQGDVGEQRRAARSSASGQNDVSAARPSQTTAASAPVCQSEKTVRRRVWTLDAAIPLMRTARPRRSCRRSAACWCGPDHLHQLQLVRVFRQLRLQVGAHRVVVMGVAAQHGGELGGRRWRVFREQGGRFVGMGGDVFLRLQHGLGQRAGGGAVMAHQVATDAEHAADPACVVAAEVVGDLVQVVAVTDHPGERIAERERVDLALLQGDAQHVGGNTFHWMSFTGSMPCLARRSRRSSCPARHVGDPRPSCPSGRRRW